MLFLYCIGNFSFGTYQYLSEVEVHQGLRFALICNLMSDSLWDINFDDFYIDNTFAYWGMFEM